jgi:hypothetical protein
MRSPKPMEVSRNHQLVMTAPVTSRTQQIEEGLQTQMDQHVIQTIQSQQSQSQASKNDIESRMQVMERTNAAAHFDFPLGRRCGPDASARSDSGHPSRREANNCHSGAEISALRIARLVPAAVCPHWRVEGGAADIWIRGVKAARCADAED